MATDRLSMIKINYFIFFKKYIVCKYVYFLPPTRVFHDLLGNCEFNSSHPCKKKNVPGGGKNKLHNSSII